MPMQIKGGVVAPASVTCDTCAVRNSCRFDQKSMNQGKWSKGPGQRARHVAYQLITDGVEGHNAKQDFCTCISFVEVLQPRMRFGRLLREDGKDGEIIRIIGQEGDTIRRKYTVTKNTRGEVIRPQREIIPALKAANIPYNLNDLSAGGIPDEIVLDIVVPPYQGKPGGSYNQELYEMELEAQRREREAEESIYAEPDNEPVSEPVKRGPGRPRKVMDANDAAE